VQAAMSGMVKFKEDPKHWIFTDNKKNIKDELTSLENFEKKFEHVT
jgi:ribosomal protein L31